jgi:hypothetical protein
LVKPELLREIINEANELVGIMLASQQDREERWAA